MRIREYRETDVPRLRAVYDRQGFTYPFPDLNDRVFFAGAVVEDFSGAAFLRRTAEAYLFIDPDAGTPRQRWQTFLRLHELLRRQAQSVGLHEVYCWVPPELGQSNKFCERLLSLGWREDKWRNFTFNL